MKLNPQSEEAKCAFFMEMANPDAWLATAIDFMQTHFQPSDVFAREQLEEWARVAGYVWPS